MRKHGEEPAAPDEDINSHQEAMSAQWGSNNGGWWDWGHRGGWGSDGRHSSWSWGETSETRNDGQNAKETTGELPDLLPDVVLGWLLLQKSGLGAGDRATVLATTRNKLGFDEIEAALRSVCTESDLRHRDQSRGKEARTNLANAVYFGADAQTWESESEDEETESEDESEDDDISEEEAEVYVAAQQKEIEAKEAWPQHSARSQMLDKLRPM